jgi:hypothetical protein
MRSFILNILRFFGKIALVPVLLVAALLLIGVAQLAIRFVLLGCAALLLSWPISRLALAIWSAIKYAISGTPFSQTYEDSSLEEPFAIVSCIFGAIIAIFLFVQSLDSTYWR